MATPAPPRGTIQIAKPNAPKPEGLLNVQPPLARSNATDAARQTPKAVSPRLKVAIRRLAPGLIETEFTTCLGDEWKLGERVDWVSYAAGKISRDPSKPSRPSRAYLHLTKPEYLGMLAEKVRNTSFTDAKGSSGDSVLLGPPIVEFAPSPKVPVGAKIKKDGRQGTIDQDQDFINFLQELTNPIPKPTPMDLAADKLTKEEKPVTPLIQFLRDKRANKGKDQATAKGGKHGRQESKDSKNAGSSDKKVLKGKDIATDKKVNQNPKVEKATREAIKVLNKQATTKNAIQAGPVASTGAAALASPAQPPAKPERKRERGSGAAAAKILQRDLGLAGGPGGRRRREPPNTSAATTTANAKEQNTKTANPSSTPAAVTSSSAAVSAASPPTGPKATPTGPAANRIQQRQPQALVQPKAAPTPAVSQTATQAFLKHANPSQGVTEPLLSEAFAPFGNVTKVEIDKKKGFAYIDFAEPESLQKAVAASPIKVAQGQVVVLERKTGANLQNRNAKGGGSNPMVGRGGPQNLRGRGGRGRGGKPNVDPKGASAAAVSPSTTTAPTGPKAAAESTGPAT